VNFLRRLDLARQELQTAQRQGGVGLAKARHRRVSACEAEARRAGHPGMSDPHSSIRRPEIRGKDRIPAE
jgi:hypothetical protein